jgi:hypothetical protein
VVSVTGPGWGWRAVAAGVSAAAGVAAGVAADVVTDRPSVPWSVGLGVLVVLLVVSQMWLNVSGSRSRRRTGAGSVYVGGSSTAPITTDVSGVRRAAGASAGSGDGAVVVDGDSGGRIRTRVTDVEEL